MPDSQPSQTTRPTIIRLLLWSILIVVLVGVALVSLRSFLVSRSAEKPVPPPTLGEVPDFELINRDGRVVAKRDLQGSPWIADFIFTQCPATCPRLSARMRDLQRALPEGEEVHLVSFSVDPDNDTPEVLARYAERFQAGENWLFLTGEKAAVYSLIRDGFKLAVDPTPRQENPEELIVHSTRLVLVDGEGRIRGYYDAFDSEAQTRMLEDLETLVKTSA